MSENVAFHGGDTYTVQYSSWLTSCQKWEERWQPWLHFTLRFPRSSATMLVHFIKWALALLEHHDWGKMHLDLWSWAFG